jgi:hypothetical protein
MTGEAAPGEEALPTEARQTRADLSFWSACMAQHGYTLEEAAEVCRLTTPEYQASIRVPLPSPEQPRPEDPVRVWPYPGGRHPRIGFLNGAVDPQRGTKASLFLPWAASDYVVIDLPEAIFSNLGLLFLAHTHVPTIWDKQNIKIENVDWTRTDSGLEFERSLPNGVRFGSKVTPTKNAVDCELWLENGTAETLTGLRTQVCLMLKGAAGFNEQTHDRKVLDSPVAAVRSKDSNHWILVAFEHCGKVWENPPVPCIHSDPVFPDAAPGATVRVRGRVWFYEGEDITGQLSEARKEFAPPESQK